MEMWAGPGCSAYRGTPAGHSSMTFASLRTIEGGPFFYLKIEVETGGDEAWEADPDTLGTARDDITLIKQVLYCQ